jgi:hypothetical protein
MSTLMQRNRTNASRETIPSKSSEPQVATHSFPALVRHCLSSPAPLPAQAKGENFSLYLTRPLYSNICSHLACHRRNWEDSPRQQARALF